MRARPHRETAETQDVLDRVPHDRAAPTMEDLVFAGEINERVQRALSDLSPQERAAFLMRHYHGCTIEEICRALDLKSNAAKHSIFRAVKKMRSALRPLLDSARHEVRRATFEADSPEYQAPGLKFEV